MGRHLAAAAVAMMAVAGIGDARAQDYPPGRPRLSFRLPLAGQPILRGRIVADIFSRHLGQKFVVENVGGAGGTIGATARRPRAADGYTILSGHLGTNALAPAFYPNLGYDPQKDFEPIGLTAEYPELLVVRKDFPANNLREFVAYAKANAEQAQRRACRVGLGILHRLPPSQRGDRHQADHGSVYRYSPRAERDAGR